MARTLGLAQEASIHRFECFRFASLLGETARCALWSPRRVGRLRRPTRSAPSCWPVRYVRSMPTFDVVSEFDAQEVRNAVDQASREIGTRFDFKNTKSSIDLGEQEITLASNTEDRL